MLHNEASGKANRNTSPRGRTLALSAALYSMKRCVRSKCSTCSRARRDSASSLSCGPVKERE